MAAPARTWLITGASSGFGREIAVAALDRGDAVVAAVRRPEAVQDLVDRVPDRVLPLRLDVTDAAAIGPAVEAATAWRGGVDVLVNNAGRGWVGAAEATTDAELRDLMDLHFFGPAALTRAVLPGMRERRSGAVVQMSSMGGRLSFPGVSAYSATKAALEGWSEALAGEVAAFGIRVLIVEPGAFRTAFNGGDALAFAAPLDAYEEQVAAVREDLANGDGAQPGDPAKAAAAILLVLDAEQAPLRLPLGADAVDGIRAALRRDLDDIATWEATSRGAVFPA